MGPIFSFMIVPCTAGVLVGWAARHWALAAAALFGGVGAFLLLMPLTSPVFLFLLPFASGVAMAGLALITVLAWRPSVSIWSRMSFGLAATFFTHFLYLSYAMAGR